MMEDVEKPHPKIELYVPRHRRSKIFGGNLFVSSVGPSRKNLYKLEKNKEPMNEHEGSSLIKETVDSTLSTDTRQIVYPDSFRGIQNKIWTHD